MSFEYLLYRGDYTKIHEFQFKKTFKHCLVGQGIYLTDSIKVAQSYRTKGSMEHDHSHTLWTGEAESRNVAFEKGFEEFCTRHWIVETGQYNGNPMRLRSNDKARIKYMDKMRGVYSALIEKKEIVANYAHPPVRVKHNKRPPAAPTHRPMFGLFGHHRSKAIPEKRITVMWDRGNFNVGYLTTFNFDRRMIDRNTVHVDRPMYDDSLWGILYDSDVKIGTICSSRDVYIGMNRRKSINDAIKEPFVIPGIDGIRRPYNARLYDEQQKQWALIRRALEPYGVIGFEYIGGIRVSGCGSHRAFCIWDEDMVNRHKVARTK